VQGSGGGSGEGGGAVLKAFFTAEVAEPAEKSMMNASTFSSLKNSSFED
jgi:hypothetical protein